MGSNPTLSAIAQETNSNLRSPKDVGGPTLSAVPPGKTFLIVSATQDGVYVQMY